MFPVALSRDGRRQSAVATFAGERRPTDEARDPPGRSAPINFIRPERKITSCYSFLGNTPALQGSVLCRPYIQTHCFRTSSGNCLVPVSLSEVILSAPVSELLTKANSCKASTPVKRGHFASSAGMLFLTSSPQDYS